jgi:Ca2+-binding EF-hand superfamily protein
VHKRVDASVLLKYHIADYGHISVFVLQADIDNSGTIDYGEFIAATLHLNKVQRQDHLFAAFQYFDKDGSGYITADELQQACDEFGVEDVRLEDMMGEVDQDNVGLVTLINSSKFIYYHTYSDGFLRNNRCSGWTH